MTDVETILITGATGTQGGGATQAIISEFTAKGKPFIIHALVRDPSSEAAQAVTQLSPHIKLFQGNFEDVASIKVAAEGATSVFLNVSPQLDDINDGEIRHGRNVIAAVKQVSTVKHFFYSSVVLLGSEKAAALAKASEGSFMAKYFKAKKTVEEEVEAAAVERGWRWTIIRPSTFFTNFIVPHSTMMYPELATENPTINTAFRQDMVISFHDPDDVGSFVAKILASEDPAQYSGQFIPIASINETLEQFIERFNKALDGRKTITLNFVPEEEAKEQAAKGDLWSEGQLFLNQVQQIVDIEEVKKYGVPLASWEEFVEKRRGRLEKAVGL